MLHLVCLVTALEAYVHRSSQWRKSDQLLVCLQSPKKGSQASKHTISKWIVKAISTAYEAHSMPLPLLIRAHSTRSVTSSKALLSGFPFKRSVMLRVGPPHTHF